MLIYLQVIQDPADQDRFVALYDYYRGLMLHVAYQVLENWQDAEDAVQEAFWVVANHMGEVSGIYSQRTRGFVATITKNKAIDIWRKRCPQEEWGVYAPSVPSPAQEVEDRLTLRACAQKLSRREQEFLQLKYDEGYSNQELGAHFGLSQEAVRKLNQRLRQHFKRLYEEEMKE